MKPLPHAHLPRGLAAAGLALTAWLVLASPAQAADPVAGASRYRADCASCHGSSPLTSNRDKIYYGRNASGAIDSSISNVSDMRDLRSKYPAGSAQLADLAAYLGNTPTTLSFASTKVGATSAAKTVTVYASLKAGFSITNLVISTTGDYRRSGGTCATALNTGTSCTVTVVFEPGASGARNGTLKIAHSRLPTPAIITLSGSGSGASAPQASVAPASLSFANTAVGATSAAKQSTLTNSGNAPLLLSTITSSSSQFKVAGGTCVAGASLAAGAACTVSMKFKPGSTGNKTGTLNIAHNAAGSPSQVSLAGKGTAAVPGATFAPASWAFANQVINTASAAKNIQLTNTGGAGLAIGAISIAPAQFKLSGGTCVANTTLAAGASCNIAVKFKPSSTGNKSGTLTVAHNAAGSPGTVALTGKGVAAAARLSEPMAAGSARSQALAFDAAAGPLIALDHSTLDFSAPEQSLTVSNPGHAALRLEGLHVVGTAADDYRLSGTCTGIDVLAPGDSCALVVGFAPGAAGDRSATLNISSNALNGGAAVTLNGGAARAAVLAAASRSVVQPDATAAGRSVLAWMAPVPKAVDFGTVAAGQSASANALWLVNRSPKAVTLEQLALQGDAADEYTLMAGGTCVAGARLAKGGTCSVVLGFSPAAAGRRLAELAVVADGVALAPMALAGQGSAVAAALLKLTPARLDLTDAAPQTVTVLNEGQAVLQVQRVAVAAGGFTVAPAGTDGCDGDHFALMPGQSCQLAVSASRTLQAGSGADTGALEVSSDASEAAVTVALSSQPTGEDIATAVPALEGGGCSIARGDTAADPVLWLLVLTAAGVLWQRRRRA